MNRVEMTAALRRIERVAEIIERDSVSRQNAIRAREIMVLVGIALRALGEIVDGDL